MTTGALDADELFVGGFGHIYVAPYGTALPDDINDSLNSAFADLGYLTEDGFRLTPAIESTDIYGWQSSSPLRTLITQRSVTLSLDFLQSNEDIFKLYFGGGSFTGNVYSPPGSDDGIDERSLVADVNDGARDWRFWFPKVVVSAAREVAFTRSAAATFGVDMKVLQVANTDLFGFDRNDSEFEPYPG